MAGKYIVISPRDAKFLLKMRDKLIALGTEIEQLLAMSITTPRKRKSKKETA